MRKSIALIATVVVLVLINWSIAGKERHLANGKVVFLELAPVDPRSLMQGDYMMLRFELSNQVYAALPKADEPGRWRPSVEAPDGYVVVTTDERNIGLFARIHDDDPLVENEVLMRYRVRNGVVKFATNAWFFQEGDADVFQPARYGQFRVDNKGGLLLAAMYDENLVKLEPTEE